MPKTDRSRSIRVNGQKIIDARRKRELDQQALSDDAKIGLRSLQRAEKGGPISKRILNNIATELALNPEDLVIMDEFSRESRSKLGHGILILRPILNYRDVAGFSSPPWDVFTLDVEYLINPPDELIEPIADVISAFEYFCVPLAKRENNERSHSEEFKKRMSLNKKIKMIIDSGISIFASCYLRKWLIWDFEQYENQPNYHWVNTSKEFLVVRFLEDVPIGKESIAVRVLYGLSDEVINRWNGDTRKEISRHSFLEKIDAEYMIDPNIEPFPRDEDELDQEIPF